MSTTLLTHGKATMVYRGGLGYCAIHLREISVATRAYARFSAALTVRSVAKGARKAKGVIYTHPDFIILNGWVDVTLPRVFGEATNGDGWTVTTSDVVLTGDVGDIDAAIKASSATVVRDFRGFDTYGRKAA
jgi:hypothetical protein